MKQSQLFTKTKRAVSQQETSINAQLLERAGYIDKLMAGVYTYLPLGYRVLDKIETIVRKEMLSLGAQEVLMPVLHPKENWQKTGRWESVDVLYRFEASEKELALGPTHEEVITPLAAQYLTSYKDLPQGVFQIQTKFRNEARPKSGLLRGREFRMKDLYSFHVNEEDLNTYYDLVTLAYERIFQKMGLGEFTYLTFASGGTFSKYSHEFQTVSSIGEDTIFVCKPCKVALNQEIIQDMNTCPTCHSSSLIEEKAIEVGNIFKLMHRFSQSFDLRFSDEHNVQEYITMGCYGIGTSRLIGTIVEVLHDEQGICWPLSVAPYQVQLLSLSKKPEIQAIAENLYHQLQSMGIEVLFDDRTDITAGQKFAEADLLGMPLRLVVSDKTEEHHSVEMKWRTEPPVTLISHDAIKQVVLDAVHKPSL